MTRVILVMSSGAATEQAAPFYSVFDNSYAAGFAAHFKDKLTTVIEVPSVLPEYLDEPRSYLPDVLPEHDAVIAINIHDEILLEIPKLSAAAGGKALLVPREDPNWTSPWLRERLAGECKDLGMESAFPKPFCSLEEDLARPVINGLMRELKIGRPKVAITVVDGVAAEIEVLRSAPCGDTYFVAANLKGKPIDDKFEWWATKYWGSYPCRGSMAFDPEFNDNMQHEAGRILLGAVRDALENNE
jgi:thymidylate synthase